MAIKVVEHRLRKSLEELDEARESLLSASVSHPNVVRCQEPACSVKIDLRNAVSALVSPATFRPSRPCLPCSRPVFQS